MFHSLIKTPVFFSRLQANYLPAKTAFGYEKVYRNRILNSANINQKYWLISKPEKHKTWERTQYFYWTPSSVSLTCFALSPETLGFIWQVLCICLSVCLLADVNSCPSSLTLEQQHQGSNRGRFPLRLDLSIIFLPRDQTVSTITLWTLTPAACNYIYTVPSMIKINEMKPEKNVICNLTCKIIARLIF